MSNLNSESAPRGRPKDPNKHKAILDAAKSLFLTQGFAGTSMDMVAAAASVSKLTVYSHFSDKETLFTAAIEAKCENIITQPIFALEKGVSIEEVLQRVGEAFLTVINSEDSIRLKRLLCGMAEQEKEMANLFFEAGPRCMLDQMEGLLGRANALGLLVIADVAVAAEHFFGMLIGCQHMRVLIGCCPPPEATEIRDRVAMAVKSFVCANRGRI